MGANLAQLEERRNAGMGMDAGSGPTVPHSRKRAARARAKSLFVLAEERKIIGGKRKWVN